MNSQYKELSDKAVYLHDHGDLKGAAEIYCQLLAIDPDDANILNLMGLLLLTINQPQSAIDYLSKSFIINHTSQSANNLGKAYYLIDKPEKAIKMFKEALKIEQDDDTYYSLGLAYKKTGDMQNAINAYKRALDENPGNYSACYNLALAYHDVDDLENAIFYAQKGTILRDNDEFLYGILSGFYEKAGNIPAAIKALQKACEINPNNYLYFYNKAVLLSNIDRDDEAVISYLKAISIDSNRIEAYVNLANILKKKDNNKAVEYLLKAYEINPKEEILLLSLAQSYKDLCKNDESIKILKELLLINPLCDEAYSIMAMNYMDLCQYEKALQNYDLALKTNPYNKNFIHGRAVALKYLGKTDECKTILENLIATGDTSVQTKITLGMMYLQDKEFEKGMQLYRLRSDNIKSASINKTDIWEPNQPIEGKTILVYSNCGLGDSIMYARYLPYLEKIAKKVYLQTDSELVAIIQESFPMINVIEKGKKPPEFDCVLQFMDIQLALGMDFSMIPSSKHYLKPNNGIIKMFKNLPMFKNDKKKIGLFWQGNKRIFKNRSIKFDIIKTLTENKDVMFYSFQLGEKIEETDNFIDLSLHIKDYSDTAAMLKNIDLLITIDSSIAHMAGALGVKTFLLLPKTAEWRWFYDEEKTPWYDSVTIFKQKESADWLEVIDRVKNSL